MRVRLPNNWTPRPYQIPAWTYLENGGRHAELIWHRRAGKDAICMHWASVAAFERVANYWHMLPQAAQARKAVWDAVKEFAIDGNKQTIARLEIGRAHV